MRRLIFYTTPGCHLCEHAAVLLKELSAQSADSMAFSIEEVDIATDEALVELYGIRIPVVKNAGTGKEVGWPFEIQDLANLF